MNLQDQRMMMLLQQMRGGGQLNRQEGGSLMNPMQPQPPQMQTPPMQQWKQMSPREIEDRERDRWLYQNSPNATPEDLKEFGLNPEGQRLDGKPWIAPFSKEDMFNELDSIPEENYQQQQSIQRHGLSPVGPDELFRQMRRQGAVGGLLDPRR